MLGIEPGDGRRSLAGYDTVIEIQTMESASAQSS